MTQPEPGFNTANRRLSLCADSRLPLLIKMKRDSNKNTTRLNPTPLFSCFPAGKMQNVECVIWRSAVCNRLRSHLFLFWFRLRSLVCLVFLLHPAGSQVPTMPIKTVSAILSVCRISVSPHTWDYLPFFPLSQCQILPEAESCSLTNISGHVLSNKKRPETRPLETFSNKINSILTFLEEKVSGAYPRCSLS